MIHNVYSVTTLQDILEYYFELGSGTILFSTKF